MTSHTRHEPVSDGAYRGASNDEVVTARWTSRSPWVRRLAAATIAVLLLAACGGGNPDVAERAAPDTVTVAATQQTPETAAQAGHDVGHGPDHAAAAAAAHDAAAHDAAPDDAHDMTAGGAQGAADDDAAQGGGGHHEHHEPALAAGPLPGTSLYHLTSAFTDQHGADYALPELRGHPAVVVMFYGDCTTACPLLVRSAEEIEDALPEDLREDTHFVMVTFDTARDTPEALRDYAATKGLDKPTWHWLVGSDLQTRQLAALLGVQYRDAGNGVFAHSNIVTVLDTNGVPSARLEGLGVALEPAIAAVREAGAGR